MDTGFAERALENAKRLNSRLILAFDPSSNPYKFKDDKRKFEERDAIKNNLNDLLSQLRGTVAGVKLGLPALLSLGPDEIERTISEYREDYFFICDSKMADIGHINRLVAELIYDMGFDALIIHTFIGAKDGVDEVVKLAKEKNGGVIALCAMTHAGANEYLNEHFDELSDMAVSVGADGFILPAVVPEIITRVRKKYPSAIIISPGVGAQGAPFGSAISAGADFEIVGRAIREAPSPVAKAKEIIEAMKR